MDQDGKNAGDAGRRFHLQIREASSSTSLTTMWLSDYNIIAF